MASEGSVSRWLDPLQQGDPDAVQQLWQRYFLDLAKLARRVLRNLPLRARDEEDVALSSTFANPGHKLRRPGRGNLTRFP